jgi:hypothetical protein
MAERAASLGGSLEAGPRDAAGWRTAIRLPLPDDRPSLNDREESPL